jgi:hypothetical protein
MCGVILLRVALARRGRSFFVRRIPGIDALEEALGRATETGRPVVFAPGYAALDNMQTLAGLSVLRWVASRCAELMARVIVPIAEPVVISAAQEILQDVYRKHGAEDRLDAADIPFYGRDQNAFAAGIIGLLTRGQAAAAFYFGSFGFESLLIAETGNRTGAIQVAATADFFQVPFFICACDYTLIGEELYAASAYLSKEPIEVGTVTGQDYAKAILLLILIAGISVQTWISLSGGDSFNAVAGLLGK